jgi:hypothetical protein
MNWSGLILALVAVMYAVKNSGGADVFLFSKNAFAKIESAQTRSTITISGPFEEGPLVKHVTYEAVGQSYLYQIQAKSTSETWLVTFAFDGKRYQHYLTEKTGRHLRVSQQIDEDGALTTADLILTPFQFLLHKRDDDTGAVPEWNRPVKLTELKSGEFWDSALAAMQRLPDESHNGHACMVLRVGEKQIDGKHFYYKVFLDKQSNLYPIAFEKVANDKVVILYDVQQLDTRDIGGVSFSFPRRAKLSAFLADGTLYANAEYALDQISINDTRIKESDFTLDLTEPDSVYDADRKQYLPTFTQDTLPNDDERSNAK